MKNVVDKKKMFSLIFNLLIVIMEIYSLILSFGKNGFNLFMFYTEDSNLFACIVCFIMFIVTFKAIKKKSLVPLWVKILKYMATCCLTLTFIVVIFVLAPMYGADGYRIMLFDGSMLFHHLLCPIFAFISFILFEADFKIDFKYNILAILPTIIYAFVTIVLNIFKIINGPYPFLRVYEQPIYMSFIWFFVIVGGAFVITVLLRLCSKNKKIIN